MCYWTKKHIKTCETKANFPSLLDILQNFLDMSAKHKPQVNIFYIES